MFTERVRLLLGIKVSYLSLYKIEVFPECSGPIITILRLLAFKTNVSQFSSLETAQPIHQMLKIYYKN